MLTMRVAPCRTFALVIALVSASACSREPVEAAGDRRDDSHVAKHRSQAELPHLVPPSKEQVELFSDAQLAMLNGNTEDAFAALEQLRLTDELSDLRRDGLLLYVELLEQRDRRGEAIALLSDFALHIPPNGDVFFVLGRLYARQGDLKNAERALRDATRAAPELLRAWLALAQMLQTTGRPLEADEVMIRYEREIYRLGRTIERSGTLEERVQAIRQFGVSLPDPRISRILARALQNDAIDVQVAALQALEQAGTSNALPALDAYIESAPNRELQSTAQNVRLVVARR